MKSNEIYSMNALDSDLHKLTDPKGLRTRLPYKRKCDNDIYIKYQHYWKDQQKVNELEIFVLPWLNRGMVMETMSCNTFWSFVLSRGALFFWSGLEGELGEPWVCSGRVWSQFARFLKLSPGTDPDFTMSVRKMSSQNPTVLGRQCSQIRSLDNLIVPGAWQPRATSPVGAAADLRSQTFGQA